MSFNEDQSELLVACFDRYIYRIANEETPRVLGRIGPLKYQVKQVEWVGAGLAFALTESGHIYKLDILRGEFISGKTETNAVWDIKTANQGTTHWVAFEDGYVRELRVDSGALEVLREYNPGLGMIRRLIPTEDGKLFVLAANSGVVALLDADLKPMWSYSTAPLLREFALSGQNLLVCTEQGELTLLNATSGRLQWMRNFDVPLWCCSISPDGRDFLVSHRLCDRGDQEAESSGSPASILIGNLMTGEISRTCSKFGNIKK
ncbi:MAG: PQQ-like beta-propeller repeat protein [Calothrix sp. SM1_5_4]|nr:PQQ-like beta-propeller repeat protein [Calothrix sp. SM1_5_4]